MFDQGDFSDDDTFLLTDWMAHVPMEVLAKNFQLPESAFSRIPSQQLYIFPGGLFSIDSSPDTHLRCIQVSPAPNEPAPVSATGVVPESFSYHLSQVPATPLSGGTIKTFDTRTFKIAETIVGALVTVQPGGIRSVRFAI